MSDNNNIQNEIQVENNAQSGNEAPNNEVIAPFKEISYEDFLANKNKIKKCCSLCCVYKTYKTMDKYANKNIEIEDLYKIQNQISCVENFLLLNFIYIIFDFIFHIFHLFFCFYMKPDFKKLKDENDFRLLESYATSDEYIDNWFDIEGFNLEFANIQPKYKLWYSLSISEIIFLFFQIIFNILFLIFLSLQKCKYYKIITEREKKQGKITKYVILGNFIFFILYLIIIFLSMYFFIFTVFVLASKTFKDNTICILKMVCQIFRTIYSFLHYYRLKNVICYYMDLNYEEKTNNNNEKDNRNEDDKIKTGFLFINNNNIKVDAIANKNLYLEENNQSQNEKENKVYEFKLIRSNKITSDFDVFYIKIKNNAYKNMLSITDWRYGININLEKIYKKLDTLLFLICLLIILLTPPFFFHAKDEEFYNRLRKIIKNNIFKIYGDFEY